MATLPIISVSDAGELSGKCTENWEKERPSACVIRMLPDPITPMAAEVKMPQGRKDTE